VSIKAGAISVNYMIMNKVYECLRMVSMPVVSIIKRDMPITMAPGILEIKIVFLARLFFCKLCTAIFAPSKVISNGNDSYVIIEKITALNTFLCLQYHQVVIKSLCF